MDTAGLREFQPWAAGAGLDAVFPEVAERTANCRFRDCRHEGEPGCAVQQALGDGSLDLRRFEHCLRLKREQDYQERRRGETAAQAEREKWKPIARLLKEFKPRRYKR